MRSTQQHVLRARNSTANSFSQARITYNRAGRKKNTVFSSPEKNTCAFFSDPKNTSVFLVFNWRHIRVFGFYSKNTSAFFSPIQKHMRVFIVSLNARHKKAQKKHKKHIPFPRFRTRCKPRGTDTAQKGSKRSTENKPQRRVSFWAKITHHIKTHAKIELVDRYPKNMINKLTLLTFL